MLSIELNLKKMLSIELNLNMFISSFICPTYSFIYVVGMVLRLWVISLDTVPDILLNF